ncbi:MAG: FecR family protein [Planctomycetia bacterium]|nr:FecR family protein [Planctomycetia bacterium]
MTQLHTLIESLCQGTATHADRDQLEGLLRDPANRAEYLAATRLHSELLWRWHRGRVVTARPGSRGAFAAAGRKASSEGGSRVAADTAGPRRRFAAAVGLAGQVVVSWLRLLARPAPFACLFAATLLTAFLVAAGGLTIDRSGDSAFAAAARSAPPIVARITGLHRVRWSSARQSWHDWDALPQGTRIDVAAGLVQVTHHAGAEVVIEGPASYQVLGADSGRLVRGRLAARTKHDEASESADRSASDLVPLFTVRTPKRLVHDLGTEFGVHVEESGDTGVHVFEGLVELAAVDHDTAQGEVAVRLGVGESAGIDEAGRVGTGSRSLARTFVRALPKADGKPEKSFLDQIGWNEASAEMIYRDTFVASGPLEGSTPASRGGVGTAAWAAPGTWTLSPSEKVLLAAGSGSALLPFQPEAGWLYRISIDLDVFAGGHNWFVICLAPAMNSAQNPLQVPQVHAWMGQRHEIHHPGFEGNFAFRGPGTEGLVMPIDVATGRQRRSILLDTRSRAWMAYFLRDDEPVARCSYSTPPASITNIALSQYGTAQTRVHEVSVARLAAPASAAQFKEKSR